MFPPKPISPSGTFIKKKGKSLLSFSVFHINACDADIYICHFQACHVFNGRFDLVLNLLAYFKNILAELDIQCQVNSNNALKDGYLNSC